MGESFKAVCSLVMIVSIIVSALSWFDDRPNQTTWILRTASPAVAAASLLVILKLQFRRDRAPDYLRRATATYFNRGGFCFAVVANAVDGVCHFHAYYQNQYERPCVGRIALRPARGFFLNRKQIDTIAFEIECGAAAFGIVTLPVPLSQEVQGKRQSFEVGASVEYPQGKGRRLRFHDGVFLRANTNFGNAFVTAITVAGAMGGAVVLSRPVTTTLALPSGVAEELPASAQSSSRLVWKLGDPPIVSR